MANLEGEVRILRLSAVCLQQPHASWTAVKPDAVWPTSTSSSGTRGGKERLVSCSLLSGDVNKWPCCGAETYGGPPTHRDWPPSGRLVLQQLWHPKQQHQFVSPDWRWAHFNNSRKTWTLPFTAMAPYIYDYSTIRWWWCRNLNRQ